MKHGRTINELAEEIQRQQESKRDFLIAPTKMNAFVNDKHIELGFPIKDNDKELFTAPLTTNGHIQLGDLCKIPKKYYDMMLVHPALLAHNANHWLQRNSDKKMVRSMDGNVRAILSDKYRRLDNFDLAQNILPMLYEADTKIESCQITESKLYIKAITHKVQAEVKPGDVVSSGLIITNSEVGHGSLSVKPLLYRLVCSNGAIVDDFAMRKYHVGRQTEMDQIEFSNETINAEYKAFWLKTRDLVKYTLNETTFEKIVEVMREAVDKKFTDPDNAIELVTKKYALGDLEKKNIFYHLIQGNDMSSWGLGNAVTRMAQDVDSYDRSTELEGIGYQIMQQKWN